MASVTALIVSVDIYIIISWYRQYPSYTDLAVRRVYQSRPFHNIYCWHGDCVFTDL